MFFRVLVLAGIVLLITACVSQRVGVGDNDSSIKDAGVVWDGTQKDLSFDSALDAEYSDATLSYVEEVVRACVYAAMCSSQQEWVFDSDSVGACVNAFAQRNWPMKGISTNYPPFYINDQMLERLRRCATSTDCNAFHTCYGGTLITTNECFEMAECDGTKAVLFFSDPNQSDKPYFDCSALGGTCQDLWTGVPRVCCATKNCSNFDSHICNGAKGTYCNIFGIAFDFDCGPTNRVCASDFNKTSELCEGTGALCDSSQPTICTGSIVTYCAGGKVATMDCSKNLLSSACIENESFFPCLPEGTECTIYDKDICDSDDLIVCVNGKKYRVNCIQLGFERCGKDPQNPDGSQKCSFYF